ncbi:MAG: cyclase family protein [Gammaproteobacteria bacterium]|nr:cyclase family protein [Gammaproteobacteria bacterium]
MRKHALMFLLFGFSMANALATKMFDLTHTFDEKTIYWPTEKGFKRQTIFFGKTTKDYFYSAYKFCAPEHGGTHIDAPIHFAENGISVDQIPIQALMGNAVVIDVSGQVKENANYLISQQDIERFEQQYRTLGVKDIVLFRTDWSKFWDNKKKYLGSDILGDVQHLHFPGLSKEAAQYLIYRQVKGLGIDSPSMDAGQSKDFPVHRLILGANKYGLENLTNLAQIPPIGAQLIIAPMKIKGGSGAPTRVFAIY